MAKAFLRPPRQTKGGTVYDLVISFPTDMPAELALGRRKRSVMFEELTEAEYWRDTLNSRGVVPGYRMLLVHLNDGLPVPAPATAPAPSAAPSPTRAPAAVASSRRGGPRMLVPVAFAEMMQERRLNFRGDAQYNLDLERDFRLYVEPFFGELYCDELVGQAISQWRYDMIRGVIPRQHDDDAMVEELEPLSKSRIKNINTSLIQLCEWAMLNAARTGVTANPCPTLRFPDNMPDPREAIFLDPDQVAQLRLVFRPEYLDLVDVGAGLGPRWGELAALRVEHVLVTPTVIRVKVVRALKHRSSAEGQPKNNEKGKRWIQVDPDTRAGQALLRAIDGKKPGDYVFTSPTGARLNNGHFHSRGWIPAMNTLREEYGWTIRPRWYDLRHTCASFMLEAGNDLFHVAKVLGHTMAVCDRVYGHLSNRAGLEATRSVDRILQDYAPVPSPDGGLVLRLAGDDYDAQTPDDGGNVIDLGAMRTRLRPVVAS